MHQTLEPVFNKSFVHFQAASPDKPQGCGSIPEGHLPMDAGKQSAAFGE
jgi:hypothetical protein